nr:DUF5688 family protein [uncultured Mediterraneibacter sp.]
MENVVMKEAAWRHFGGFCYAETVNREMTGKECEALEYSGGKAKENGEGYGTVQKTEEKFNEESKRTELLNRQGMDVIGNLKHYEVIKECLILRPLYLEHVVSQGNQFVYQKEGDIALVLYVTLLDDSTGLASMKITKGIFECWQRSKEEVMQEALSNMFRNNVPRILRRVEDCLNPAYLGEAFMSAEQEMKFLERNSVPVVTTTKKLNGAMAMFYPGVREKLAELFGDSYYVVFTSIHEARLHCKGTVPVERMRWSLKEVNRTFPEDEKLTEKIYFYDKDRNRFEEVTY